jgi:hypothetical protein
VIDQGSGQVVVTIPWTKRLIGAPFPSMGYSALGLAIVALATWRRRARAKFGRKPK